MWNRASSTCSSVAQWRHRMLSPIPQRFGIPPCKFSLTSPSSKCDGELSTMLTVMLGPQRKSRLSHRLYINDGLHNPVYAFASRNTMLDYSLPILTPATHKAHITLQQAFNQQPVAQISPSPVIPDFARGYKDD